MSNVGGLEGLFYNVVDALNALKRTQLGGDDVAVEILRTISILLNALKRYYMGIKNESRSDMEYSLELLKTSSDSLISTIRALERRLRRYR